MENPAVTPTVELLAPAGKWDVLEAVIANGADAVYLGGKKLNMRMLRPEFNFSDQELIDAAAFAHERGKKLYITVNNLYYTEELPELAAYLEFLHRIKVDALIVQDMAVPYLCRQLGLDIPLHVSVQANTNSVEGIKALQRMGVSRVITSRDLSLEEVYQLRQATGVEIECFIHGDMCVAHTGLCYTSSLVFGQSSNRGRCLKPCRWPYELVDANGRPLALEEQRYLLAPKDLCLYPFIPELIAAGVCSFKIEGRMREGSFLGPIVRAYRQAIDRYLADPAGYQMDQAAWRQMVDNRVRDFYTGSTFKNLGASGFGYTGEREPQFPTRAIPHPQVTPADVKPPVAPERNMAQPELAVRVGTVEAAVQAAEAGASVIYIGGEGPTGWTLSQLREAIAAGHRQGSRVVAATPVITTRREMREVAVQLDRLVELGADGVMVGNWGTLYLTSQTAGLPIYADYTLNVANTATLEMLNKEWLVERVTASLELNAEQVAAMAGGYPLELVVHGRLPGMVMNYCPTGALLAKATRQDYCARPCQAGYSLRDNCGQDYRLMADQYCRTHVLMPYDLCLLPFQAEWGRLGLASVRIEGQYYEARTVARLVRIYRQCLKEGTVTSEDWAEIRAIHPQGCFAGAFDKGR